MALNQYLCGAMAYILQQVRTRSQFRKFINLPYRLYRGNQYYVPGLRSDEKAIFTKSPCLDYCKLRMWIVLDGKRAVGRIAGIINPRYNDLHDSARARFGWIEFEKDIEIARMLLEAAEKWAADEGMTEITGPLGYNSWYKQGMLVYGFDHVPPVNCIYNFDYYPVFLEELGYQKESDMIQYRLSATQGASDRLKRIAEVLMKRYPLRIADVRELRKNDDMIDRFFEHYNQTFRKVHNFIPLTDKEINVLGRQYVRMLRPELNCFVLDDKDRIAAYGLCFPFMSEAFRKARGRLFPFGWYHLLRGYSHYEGIDLMMVGADPAWQRKGVSAIYNVHLARQFNERGIKFAITNPQNEHNPAIKVWEDYREKELYMRRRCYIKSLR